MAVQELSWSGFNQQQLCSGGESAEMNEINKIKHSAHVRVLAWPQCYSHHLCSRLSD